jgi:hypothetical protein
MGFGSHATRVSAPKRDWTIAPLRPPPTSPRIQRPAAKCPAVCFVVTKLPTLGPNTRRNLAAFPIASRVRRKRQRLRSNRLIESAAARFHISRYSSAAALPISPSVSRPVAQFPRAPSSDRNLTAGRTLAGPLSPFRRCRWLRAHRCNSLACTIEEGPQTLVRSDGSN